MTAYPTVPVTVDSPAIRFGASHGYAMTGDQIYLSADLDILDFEYATSTAWALQLWAIDTPFAGGELRGAKIAEVPLDPLSETDLQPVFAAGSAFAWLPAGVRDWNLLMVLAADETEGFRRIHDVIQYPYSERFALPCIQGNVGYRFTAEQIELTVDEIWNPRDPGNMSGTLSLELWALTAPYAGSTFDGVPLAGVVIGSLPGQGQYLNLRTTARPAPMPPGCWHLVLMLREWTSMGYVTRDYANFEVPYVSEAPRTTEPVQTAIASEAIPQSATDSEQPDPVAMVVSLPPENENADKNTAPVPSAPMTAVVSLPPEKDAGNNTVPAQLGATKEARVSVNRANVAELVSIKGLSQAVAKAIIAGRPFAALEELLQVKGIGAKTLGRLRDRLKL